MFACLISQLGGGWDLMAFDGRCRALLPKVSRFAVTYADPLDVICTGNYERGINGVGAHNSEPPIGLY
jgi:hypothetical protein